MEAIRLTDDQARQLVDTLMNEKFEDGSAVFAQLMIMQDDQGKTVVLVVPKVLSGKQCKKVQEITGASGYIGKIKVKV